MYVAPLEQVASGSAMRIATPIAVVAVFNVDGRLYAIDDGCVRCGTSLANGALAGTRVACPGCGWRYDLATGVVDGVPSLWTDTFTVRVVDAQVQVDDAPRGSPR